MRISTLILILLIGVLVNPCIAQNNPNLIPNYGFESLNDVDVNWFYKGDDFTSAIKFWSSPTNATPDIYSPDIKMADYWKKNGFGKVPPFSGTNIVGLTLYGCKNGKPHCKEFLQIPINEPLIIGQTYQMTFHVARMQASLAVNNIGISFSQKRIKELSDQKISLKPFLASKTIIKSPPNKWRKVTFQFKAKDTSKYLILGNFYSDDKTKALKIETTDNNFAYYYFDNVILTKVPPFLQVKQKKEHSFYPIEKGAVFRLEKVRFDYNDRDFLPNSMDQLNQLVNLMNEYPTMVIKVEGHTDSRGNARYNKWLSLERAKAVYEYLITKGISRERLHYEGFGSSRPSSNINFSENRRVEFRILKL